MKSPTAVRAKNRSLVMRRNIMGITVLMVTLFASPLVAQEPEKSDAAGKPETHASIWMKLKLDYSQKILQGLAEGDFDRIAQNAEAMQAFNKFESLLRRRPPGYVAQLEMFKDANAELIKQAQRENLDGATLAYTQLTLSCINCHRRLRESHSK
jgi:hypothetical protein